MQMTEAMRAELARDFVFLCCLVGIWFAPRFGERVFKQMEQWGTRISRRKGLVVFSIASAAIVIRVSLLWLMPVPFPQIHDEFSYLLSADTFAQGRLTNPAHPMAVFFDTMHVNQQPTYESKYPPGQGAVLALGQLLGSPWIGVLLGVGAMCGAMVWMLQGWMPPRWALLGGVLVVCRLGIFSYWVNSYWGGALAATGGALAIGALPRILRWCRVRDALLLALGLVILVNTRPVEGLCSSLPIFVVLRLLDMRKQKPGLACHVAAPGGASVLGRTACGSVHGLLQLAWHRQSNAVTIRGQ